MSYITHVVMHKVSNMRKDNKGLSLSTTMKVDSGNSQINKTKRLTKLLQGSYRRKAKYGQPVASSYLERVVQRLQSSNSCRN